MSSPMTAPIAEGLDAETVEFLISVLNEHPAILFAVRMENGIFITVDDDADEEHIDHLFAMMEAVGASQGEMRLN